MVYHHQHLIDIGGTQRYVRSQIVGNEKETSCPLFSKCGIHAPLVLPKRMHGSQLDRIGAQIVQHLSLFSTHPTTATHSILPSSSLLQFQQQQQQ